MGIDRLSPAHLGVGVGIIWFASAPLLLGEHHASLVWLLAWAVFWAPSFFLIEANRRGEGETPQLKRILAGYSVTAAKIVLVIYPLYAAGRLIAP